MTFHDYVASSNTASSLYVLVLHYIIVIRKYHVSNV